MRLYTRTGATALDHPTYGHFEADAQGGFNFPDEVSDQVRKFAVRGEPMWETDIERQQRLIAEEIERRKDPATLLSVVEQLMQSAAKANAVSTPPAEAEPVVKAPTRRTPKRAAAAPADE